MTPRAEYLQEVGRDLIIPCEAKGDPVPNITWSKVGSENTYTHSLLLLPRVIRVITTPGTSVLTSPNVCCGSQIGPLPRSPYMVLANGSLLLQPLSKDHHGGWECLATNHVATVSAGTLVMALGEWDRLLTWKGL